MPACERCWSIYSRRVMYDEFLTYADVVAEEESERGPCSPEEQCGEMHLVLDFKDGSRRCRCGKVVEGGATMAEPYTRKDRSEIADMANRLGMNPEPLHRVLDALHTSSMADPAVYEFDGCIIIEWPNGLTLDYHCTADGGF